MTRPVAPAGPPAALLAACLAACAAAPRPASTAAPGASPHTESSTRATCAHAAPVTCPAPTPSLETDARAVLEQRCFGCHAGDGAAAAEHDFTSMARVRAARPTIRDEVASCAMPPTSPLDDSDADTLLRWTACGP